MPPSTGTRQRLVGLITVLLVILAITVVMAFGTKTKQSQINIKTISGKSSLAKIKELPKIVSTTTTVPVLVQIHPYVNALRKYLNTVTTTTVPQPVVHHHVQPPPAPTVAVVPRTCEAMVQRIFPEVFTRAMQIAHRESRCTANAFNGETCNPDGSHAYGVFQLCLPLHADLFVGSCVGKWTDLYCGVTAARRLYDGEGGWYPAWG